MQIATIKSAIRHRHLLKLRYQHQPGQRTFAPHVIFHGEGRTILVAGVQQFNPDKPLEKNQWRTFDLAKLAQVNETRDGFLVDREYDRTAKTYEGGIISDVIIPTL